MCLFNNFMEAIKMTYSKAGEKEPLSDLWNEELFQSVMAEPVSEKEWPQVPTKGHRNISNQAEFDRLYGQSFDGLEVL